MRFRRTWTLTLLGIAVLSPHLAAQSLSARIDRDQLRIAVAGLHLLAGGPLERLRDGATVNYDFQLVLRSDRNGRTLARVQQRFAVSYDLWEEKFAVTRLETPPRSVSHLSAAAAEAWCIENLSLPIAGLAADQPFWLRLDFRTEDSNDSVSQPDNTGLTLSGLIDIFSRRSRIEQLRGFEEAGPLRLMDLRKKSTATK